MARMDSLNAIGIPLSVSQGGTGSSSQLVPLWTKVPLTFTQFQTAATMNAVTVFTLPINGYIHRAMIAMVTPFSGTATITLSLGKSGLLTRYIGLSDATAAAGTVYGDLLTGFLFESTSVTTPIQVNAISTINNLSSLSAGAANLYIQYSVLQ